MWLSWVFILGLILYVVKIHYKPVQNAFSKKEQVIASEEPQNIIIQVSLQIHKSNLVNKSKAEAIQSLTDLYLEALFAKIGKMRRAKPEQVVIQVMPRDTNRIKEVAGLKLRSIINSGNDIHLKIKKEITNIKENLERNYGDGDDFIDRAVKLQPIIDAIVNIKNNSSDLVNVTFV